MVEQQGALNVCVCGGEGRRFFLSFALEDNRSSRGRAIVGRMGGQTCLTGALPDPVLRGHVNDYKQNLGGPEVGVRAEAGWCHFGTGEVKSCILHKWAHGEAHQGTTCHSGRHRTLCVC